MNIKVSLPLYFGCHFLSKLSPLPAESAQNPIVCIPPSAAEDPPISVWEVQQNRYIRKTYLIARGSDVADLLGYQAEEIRHGYALGHHMQGRDGQDQRNKEKEDNDNELIFLAFSAPSHKH